MWWSLLVFGRLRVAFHSILDHEGDETQLKDQNLISLDGLLCLEGDCLV